MENVIVFLKSKQGGREKLGIERDFTRLQRIERIGKRLSITFIVYTYLYLIVQAILPEFNQWGLSFFKFHVPVYTYFSFYLVVDFLGKDLNIFKFLFEEDADDEEIIYRILKNLGIGLLYFVFQMCLMIYFLPDFSETHIINVPLYLPLFICNSFLITGLYRYLYQESFSLKTTHKRPKTY